MKRQYGVYMVSQPEPRHGKLTYKLPHLCCHYVQDEGVRYSVSSNYKELSPRLKRLEDSHGNRGYKYAIKIFNGHKT